jgi:hypothetical protein
VKGTRSILRLVKRARRAPGRTGLLAWACAVFVSLAGGAVGQDSSDVRDAKSAYLPQFAAYVSWPDSVFTRSDSPLVIAVASADGLYEELVQNVSGRKVGRRPLAARRVQRGETLAGMHMLFIGNGAGAWASELLAQARNRPILVVTESEAGLPPGSAINFLMVDRRLRFDVSLEAAEVNGLKVSALLLSAARQVVRK